MMMVKITMMIDAPQASNPHARVMSAIAALNKAVAEATPDQPALGGTLLYAGDQVVGSYIVEFGG